MEPEFVLTENLMPQMMGKLSKILKIYKGDPGTHTLTEATTGTYNPDFMQAMTQEIK